MTSNLHELEMKIHTKYVNCVPRQTCVRSFGICTIFSFRRFHFSRPRTFWFNFFFLSEFSMKNYRFFLKWFDKHVRFPCWMEGLLCAGKLWFCIFNEWNFLIANEWYTVYTEISIYRYTWRSTWCAHDSGTSLGNISGANSPNTDSFVSALFFAPTTEYSQINMHRIVCSQSKLYVDTDEQRRVSFFIAFII